VSWRLHVRRWGQRGPFIVMLHGLGASGRFWRPIAEGLSDQYRVVAPDLLGFGLSPWPNVDYTVEEHLDALDVTLAAEQFDRQPLLLVGHSLGASLALAWAARHPSRCAGLVLIGLPCFRSPGWAREHLATLGPAAYAVVIRPILGAAVCSLICFGRPFWQMMAPFLLRRVPAEVAEDGMLHTWRSYSQTLKHCVLDLDTRPLVTRVTAAGVPTRLVHGDHDREVPLAEAAALATATDWPLVKVAGADHLLPLDRPDACLSAIRALAGTVSHTHRPLARLDRHASSPNARALVSP